MSIPTTPVQPQDKAEVAVLKTVSARLKEARGLAGANDYQIVNWLGVSPSELTALENGISSAPLSTIQKAARLYDVSIDYLFGETDDWELCPEVRRERDFAAHLQSLFAAEQAKIAVKLVDQDNQIIALTEAVAALAPAIKAVYDAMMRFWELNQNFDEMPGGAPVISTLDRADKAAHAATCQMVRHGFLPPETLISDPAQEQKNQTANHG